MVRELRTSASTDVIVIGAGVAGLAVAGRLHEQGLDSVILEARDRIGGRVWTVRPPSLTVPVELGAEFIHGAGEAIEKVAEGARLRMVDVCGRRFASERGRLRALDDFWERLDRVMRPLDAEREPDRSFAEALSRRRAIRPADRALAVQFVEGFHAADTTVISERALAEGGSPRGDVREQRIGRLLDGFDRVVDALVAPVRDRVRLGAMVHCLRWERGHVEVEWSGRGATPGGRLAARAAVVTVPLGVLAAPSGAEGAITFDPPVPRLARALGGMEMGNVIRIALQLDRPFWTSEDFARRAGDERLDTLSFLHARSRVDFPVWWTQHPLRAPLLVGWRGGPGARLLARRPPDELRDAATRSLATLLGVDTRTIEARIVAVHAHDWIGDPFARGVYAYARVGGDGAPARLARPVQDTLYFAGEHTDQEGATATVHGAIDSGWRRADALVRALQTTATR